MWIRSSEQLKSLQTNGKKECSEYFLITKTLVCRRFVFGPLRLKKKQWKDSATQQINYKQLKKTLTPPMAPSIFSAAASHPPLPIPPASTIRLRGV
jgi:hypothetical protein